MEAKIRAVITGSTGMVGEGVLYECLQSPKVEAVLVINRKPCGYSHPKLKEIILIFSIFRQLKINYLVTTLVIFA